jgi:hypothetical protein
MEPEGSWPRSQKPDSDPYPKPDASSPQRDGLCCPYEDVLGE